MIQVFVVKAAMNLFTYLTLSKVLFFYIICLNVEEIFFKTTGDPGCYAPFLLNVYHLEPGEAIYVPAGERVNPNNLSIHKSKFGQCGIVN